MRPRIFIARPIQRPVIDRVAQFCEVTVHPADAPMLAPQFAEAISGMDGVISVGGNVSDEVLARAPKLRVVANIGAGYDTINVAACTKRRIAVSNTPEHPHRIHRRFCFRAAARGQPPPF